jgi:tRNA splicing endonuclease
MAIKCITDISVICTLYAIFEARGRIKQNRVNNFIEGFSEFLGQYSEEKINLEQIGKEEFGDFFEELIIKVAKTHSAIKIEAFKNLLANQLIEPKAIEYADLLLDIAGNLQEKQIPILHGFNENFASSYVEYSGQLIEEQGELSKYEKELKAEYWKLDSDEDAFCVDEIQELERNIESQKKTIGRTKELVQKHSKPFKAETYNCEGYEFFYLIQDLANKGLVVDMGVKYGAEPFALVEITQLGMDLIEFIKEKKPAANNVQNGK